MFRSTMLIAALAGAGVTSAAAQDLSLQDVLGRYYEAVGGVQALHAIQTRRVTGHLELGGNDATFTELAKRPNKTRMDIAVQGQQVIQAFDGQSGWMLNPFMGQTSPERMPDEFTRLLRQRADLDGPLVDYAAKGNSVELAGREDVQGKSAYKLKLTNGDGEATYYFIDPDRFLILESEATVTFQGSPMTIRTVLSDYKPENGLMVAHTVEVQSQGPTQRQTIDSVEFNVDIPDSAFAMPSGGSR